MELIKDISDLSNYRPLGGDLLKLFQLSVDQGMRKEEIVTFFQTENYFRVTYKKLKDQLLDGILSNSFKDLTKVQYHHFNIRKRYLEGQMLIQTGKKKAGIKIAEETLVSAEKYGLMDIMYLLSKDLEEAFSTSMANTAKRKKYVEKKNRYLEYFTNESYAQSVYSDLAFNVIKKKPIKHIAEDIEKLKLISLGNEQIKFRLYFYSTKILYYHTIKDKRAVQETCKTAINFFNKISTPIKNTARWNFHFQLIPLHLSEKRFSEAELAINHCIKFPKKGSYNWHQINLLQVLLGFYSRKPKIALKAFNMAKDTPSLFESNIISSRWAITEAYFCFFHDVGLMQYPNKFRLYRFLNQPKSDKIGPLTSLILELLHLLSANKRSAYMERAEHIESFIQQHLKGINNSRARYFLRMLKTVETADYSPIRVAAHAKKHIDKLKTTSLEIDLEIFDKEPVPYEFLWEMVLILLERNQKKR